jgi:ABC-type phosphate transport system auxiliary subunit
MCRENIKYFVVPFAFLFFAWAVGALRAEDRWYLISETELLSIEKYRLKSEQERQNWLSQAQNLSMRAERLEMESGNLNQQLERDREMQKKSDQLFNEFERESLNKLSSKNGEIADLEQKNSELTLRATKAEATAALYLVIIIALVVVIVLGVAFLVWKKFHPVAKLL